MFTANISRNIHPYKESLMLRQPLILAIAVSLLFSVVTVAQVPPLGFAGQLGGTLADTATSLAVDTSGNVYITGYFNGSADMDPGPGIYNLTSLFAGIFIVKLDPSGNFVWAKQFSGTATAQSFAIALDSTNNILITGRFQGTIDFDPDTGTTNLTAFGNDDIFVSKLDSSGNFIWIQQMGGSSADQAREIALDIMGNIYTTGTFGGTADFDPGASTATLTTMGNQDVFVSKLDSSGNFVWVKQFGGINTEQAYGIALDTMGNIYTTGAFSGLCDFDPSVAVNTLTSPLLNIFVSKLDSSGNFVWARHLAGNGIAEALAVTIDSANNILTTGYIDAATDFDPGAGTFILTPTSTESIFISKLNTSGDFVWAKLFAGSTSFNRGNSITTDTSNNVYTSGIFSGTGDFDPGADTFTMVSVGFYDGFVSKLDASGDFEYAWGFGDEFIDGGFEISVDNAGNVYAAGYFSGTVDFDPGAGTADLTGFVDSQDAFIFRLESLEGLPNANPIAMLVTVFIMLFCFIAAIARLCNQKT